jgi:hypothetical protein
MWSVSGGEEERSELRSGRKKREDEEVEF